MYCLNCRTASGLLERVRFGRGTVVRVEFTALRLRNVDLLIAAKALSSVSIHEWRVKQKRGS